MNVSPNSRKNIIEYLLDCQTAWAAARAGLEEDWVDAWANFIGSPQAYAWLERTGLYKYVGTPDDCDKGIEWRHRVHTGKGFEMTELLWAYFMQATFSNERWFDVVVDNQEYLDEARLIRQLMANELRLADFDIEFGDWLRQLINTGTSAMRIRWCSDKCGLKFEPISNSRLYLQPTVPAHKADLMVVHFTTRRALKQMIGAYNLLDMKLLMELKDGTLGTEEEGVNTTRAMSGVDNIDMYSPQGCDKITLYEYYGTIYDDMDLVGTHCKAVFCGKHLLHLETNYDCPIVATTFISILEQSWGMSPTTASSGLMAADRIFLNSRLDNLHIATQDAYTYMPDRVIDPDFTVFPGAKIGVLEQDAIRPMPRGNTALPLTYQEEAALNARIDKNVGTIPGVGSGQQRQAERVTAQEVISAKQVGGTRHNQYHLNIERRGINKMLNKAYTLLGKYGTKERAMMYNSEGLRYSIGYIAKEACTKEVVFTLRGSEAVLAQNTELTRTIEFVSTVGNLPGMENKVNWDYVLRRMADLWGLSEPDKVLVNEANPGSTEQDLPQTQQAAVQAQMAVDGGAGLAEQAYSDMRLK